MPKAKNHRAKKPTKCPCFKGWVCEDHPNQPWGHKGCEASGELCRNPQCHKDPDSIFLSVHCQVQPGRRKPAVRKTSLKHLTRFEKKGAGLSPAPHCGESGGLRGVGRGLILTALNRADGARLIGEHQAQKASQELLPRRPILSCLK